MAAMTRGVIVTLVVIGCLVSAFQLAAGSLEDGLPRPPNIDDTPFTSHGPRPEAKYPDGAVANCKWYGFINRLYNRGTGAACVNALRTALVDASQDSMLEPFVFYYLAGETGTDPANDERYCYEGCFNLELDGGPAASPSPSYFSPAPSPGGNFIRGPSLAPDCSPQGSPVPSPAYAPSFGDPTPAYAPAPESGA